MNRAIVAQIETLVTAGHKPRAIVNALAATGKHVDYEAVRMIYKRVVREAERRAAGKRLRVPQIPDDFDALALVIPTKTLAEQLGVSRSTIRIWRRLRNIPTPGRAGVRRERKPTSGTPIFAYKPAPVTIHRDLSAAGRAVSECLQRLGRIFRCDPDGRVNPKGTHWNRNGFILSDDDVIDRARRNGRSPDDWERIAA